MHPEDLRLTPSVLRLSAMQLTWALPKASACTSQKHTVTSQTTLVLEMHVKTQQPVASIKIQNPFVSPFFITV
jgi:hypothetical protein